MIKKYMEPEWLKLSEAAPVYGISIPELFRACVKGDIESAHIVKPGKRKGIRLLSKRSLDEYIRSFMPGGSRYQKSVPAEITR